MDDWPANEPRYPRRGARSTSPQAASCAPTRCDEVARRCVSAVESATGRPPLVRPEQARHCSTAGQRRRPDVVTCTRPRRADAGRVRPDLAVERGSDTRPRVVHRISRRPTMDARSRAGRDRRGASTRDGDGAGRLDVVARRRHASATAWKPNSASNSTVRCSRCAGRCPLDLAVTITTRSFVPGADEARLARGEQPGLRRSPRAGRLDAATWCSRVRARGLVRSRRVPAPRARRAAGRVLLDQGASRPTANDVAPRRDLRDRRRSRLRRARVSASS